MSQHTTRLKDGTYECRMCKLAVPAAIEAQFNDTNFFPDDKKPHASGKNPFCHFHGQQIARRVRKSGGLPDIHWYDLALRVSRRASDIRKLFEEPSGPILDKLMQDSDNDGFDLATEKDQNPEFRPGYHGRRGAGIVTQQISRSLKKGRFSQEGLLVIFDRDLETAIELVVLPTIVAMLTVYDIRCSLSMAVEHVSSHRALGMALYYW